MKIIDGLIGGMAGAIGVTLLHELTRKIYPDAPRLDLLGEQATAKVIKKATGESPKESNLYGTALAGDLIANALYYGLAAANAKHPIRTGGTLGITAGLGAISLPGKMGLNTEHASGSLQRKLITVGLYTLGGIIAGTVVHYFRGGRLTTK